MGQSGYFHPQINLFPQPPEGTNVHLSFTPEYLVRSGLSIPILISTPALAKLKDTSIEVRTATIYALFDTGATKTSIDVGLAQHLALAAVGMSTISTAAGLAVTPDFVADISFPGTPLRPFANIPVGSCTLNPKKDDNGHIIVSPTNIAALIGRDIMSRWNIVWNGPTSSVFISD